LLLVDSVIANVTKTRFARRYRVRCQSACSCLQVTRIDGYEKQPLRLEMASFVQSGVLHIETVDDEPATSFRASLSDILPQATVSSCDIFQPPCSKSKFSCVGVGPWITKLDSED